ncbi:MAG: glycerol-3-phosphate 1-O-acyltransferase PlsY [Endomicrobium sp.]|jgi:glycerol-3-phosphate acyltransferase PlsY|nr:glycerol-3-phosphate 1-O-acyltransferase PlsY [Endomicrobium sp.]
MLIKILYIIFAYLCGSIPFSYIVAKMIGKIDIRTVGSGNSGTTNVFRSVGSVAGIIVFVADVSKGFIPVHFMTLMNGSFFYFTIVALAVILGHVFTIFLNFKGGKGIATGFGVSLALMPLPTLVAFAVFGLIFIFSGYVSLGSICAAISFPLISYFLKCDAVATIFACTVAILIIYKHKGNIKRLKNGSENRFRVFKGR